VGQMIRRSPAEKREIVHLVEHSALPVGRTLDELDVPRSSFSRKDTGTVYRWYRQYQQDGQKGLEPQPSRRRQFWNRLPESVCDQIIQLALAEPEKSARQLAWQFTDQEGYFVSESSVFRLLKRFDLVESPAFQLVTSAGGSSDWPGRRSASGQGQDPRHERILRQTSFPAPRHLTTRPETPPARSCRPAPAGLAPKSRGLLIGSAAGPSRFPADPQLVARTLSWYT